MMIDGCTPALVVWQPWASLIAAGVKTIETRGWRTESRRRILIYAAKVWGLRQRQAAASPAVRNAMVRAVFGTYMARTTTLSDDDRREVEARAAAAFPMPIGGPVAVATLRDCRLVIATDDGPAFRRSIDAVDLVPRDELVLGDYRPGRFGWRLDDVVPIDPTALPAGLDLSGRQGLFYPPAVVVAAVNSQLSEAVA